MGKSMGVSGRAGPIPHRTEEALVAGEHTPPTRAPGCRNAMPRVEEAPMGAIGQRTKNVAWWGQGACPLRSL
jgi:hypothetical protein